MNKKISVLLSTLAFSTLALGFSPKDAQAAVFPTSHTSALMAEVVLEGKININTAGMKQWELLPGIGPSTAKKLVSYSAKKPFAEINQIMRIKGIGRKTFTKIKNYLSLKGDTTLQHRK